MMEVWDQAGGHEPHPLAEFTQEHTNQMPYDEDEMLPEYDLENRQGVRGKYYHGTREAHTVHVYQGDGAVQKHYYTTVVAMTYRMSGYQPDIPVYLFLWIGLNSWILVQD